MRELLSSKHNWNNSVEKLTEADPGMTNRSKSKSSEVHILTQSQELLKKFLIKVTLKTKMERIIKEH